MARTGGPAPLAVFDLDRTLLDGRTILHVAERFGVLAQVQAVWDHHRQQELAAGEEESRAIAALFGGVDAAEFERACAGVPLMDGAREAVAALQLDGFRVGVVSASYRWATRDARARLGLDFDVGVGMEIEEKRLTGRLMAQEFRGACGQYVCKEAAMSAEAAACGAPFTVAVGDGANDVCMLKAADCGIGIEPCHPRVRAVADVVVRSLRDVPAAVRARRAARV